MNIEQAIEADLSVQRRCFAYGRTPLGASDFVRPDGPKEIQDGKVFLRDIDGGHRGYWVPIDEYLELRKHPMRHIGIWEFVSEAEPAADTVAWAVINAQSAGYALFEARQEIKQMKAALETARPAFENLASNQRQLDMDGCEVGVSRQAVEETLDGIRAALGDHKTLAAHDTANAA